MLLGLLEAPANLQFRASSNLRLSDNESSDGDTGARSARTAAHTGWLLVWDNPVVMLCFISAR
jgi:hypothetical protein